MTLPFPSGGGSGGGARWSPTSVPAVSARAAARAVDRVPHVQRAGRHRDVTHAEPGQRVDDRVDHRRRGADRAGLADALDAELVGRRRRHGVAERDRRHVAGRRHQVLGQRAGLEVAVRVVHGLLEQRLGEALHDSAVDLPVDDQRVDLDAAVVDGDVLEDIDAARLRVDLHDAHVGAERPGEVGRVVRERRPRGWARGRRAGCARRTPPRRWWPAGSS